MKNLILSDSFLLLLCPLLKRANYRRTRLHAAWHCPFPEKISCQDMD